MHDRNGVFLSRTASKCIADSWADSFLPCFMLVKADSAYSFFVVLLNRPISASANCHWVEAVAVHEARDCTISVKGVHFDPQARGSDWAGGLV